MFANKIYLSDNYFVNNNGIEKFMRINPIFRGNIDNKPQTTFKSISDIKIIPSKDPSSLEKNISDKLQIEPSPVTVKKFANSETYVRIDDNLRNKDVYIMPPSETNVNDALMEVNLKADAAKRSGAKKVIAVLPNFPYARQERRTEPGEPVSAKVAIDIMKVSGVDEFITIDLHSPAIEGFSSNDTPFYHLSSMPVMAEYISKKDIKNACIVSPDEGGAKRAKKLANKLNMETATVQKTRTAHNSATALGLFGNVEGKNCIIYDDIIDTAGTIAEASKMLKSKGAKDIYILATHGLFNKNAAQTLDSAPIKEVITTNTVPKKPNGPSKAKQIDTSGEVVKAMLDISA